MATRVSCNGVQLAVEDSGEGGPTVLFSHGLLYSLRMWDAQICRAPPALPVHRLRPSRAGRERGATHRAGHGHADRGRGGADPHARHRAGALRGHVDGGVRRNASGGASSGARALARPDRHLRGTRAPGEPPPLPPAGVGRALVRDAPGAGSGAGDHARGERPEGSRPRRGPACVARPPPPHGRGGDDPGGGGGAHPAERDAASSPGSTARRWCWWARRTPRPSPRARRRSPRASPGRGWCASRERVTCRRSTRPTRSPRGSGASWRRNRERREARRLVAPVDPAGARWVSARPRRGSARASGKGQAHVTAALRARLRQADLRLGRGVRPRPERGRRHQHGRSPASW